jgi:hypothetical protein
MAKTLRQLLEAKYVSSADFVLSAGGRKVHKRKKIADDDYSKEDDLDNDGDNDADDKKLANESAVPVHMQGKQKPYVSSDGKGNYEVLGNRGQTKAEFSRKEHGKYAQSKAQAHLKSKYDEYMKEETEIDEGVNKSDVPAYLRKKIGDKLTTQDLDKERTQNRSHPETIKKINGTEMKEQAPVAPSIGVHRIGVTVSDSDHPAVTKRKELIQKFVRVTAHDKDRAIEIGKKHFAKKGWKVHDANHSGMVHEEAINEYSMDDVRKDAADHLKKSIDKQSDDRIAALKNPPKKKGFFARVGEKQINMVKGAYHGLTKEEVELEEAKDKTDKRFDLLARLGLVEKDELANLRLAMKTLSEDKQLSIKQRDLLLNVYESLISLVTGDDTMFSRMKIKVQEQMLDEKKDSDKGEYDYEGQMARTQLQTILRNSEDLVDMIEDDENMPEWVQSKITLAQDYITTVRDYLQSKEELGEETNLEEEGLKDACWKGYTAIGMKMKNGKKVPNCVPKEGVENVPFDGPYTKTPDSIKDKSGAEHTPQSRARHLARLAMKQMAKKSKKA